MTHPAFDEMRTLVGGEHVIADPRRWGARWTDWGPYRAPRSDLVVRPGTVAEVARVLAVANRAGWPVTTRGGGVSMTGFIPVEDPAAITLDTRRLNRIVAVDTEDMVVTAEAGISMAELEAAVEEKGCYVPTVVVPAAYVTLGGVLSGVVGGGLPVRGALIGTLEASLVSLAVVVAEGRVLQTAVSGPHGRAASDVIRGAGGPDLAGLFVGDGGVFGVKVEATLRIFPHPSCTAGGRWRFGSMGAARQALEAISALAHPPYTDLYVRGDVEPALLFATEGPTADVVAANVDMVAAVCRAAGGRPASDAEAADAEGRARGTSLRGDEYVRRPAAIVAFLCPRSRFAAVHDSMTAFLDDELRARGLDDRGVRYTVAFRPHLRSAIYEVLSIEYDPADPFARREVADLTGRAYERVVALGGHPEPRQGGASVALAASWPPEHRAMLGAVKRVLDPNRILNRGVWGL